MGSGQSAPVLNGPDQSQSQNCPLVIVGLATQWPGLLMTHEDFDRYVCRWYNPEENPSIARLLKLNRESGIETRAIIDLENDALLNQLEPPSAEYLDQVYRQQGVDLAVGACQKALREWGGSAEEVTHVVAVTATNGGSPGYDQLVALRLGIPADAERVLLNGVGCAGGLAALRVGASLCLAAEHCGRPARVLIFATEICSIQIRCELEAAMKAKGPCIGPGLFGDGAAALVLCNGSLSEANQHGVYSLMHWMSRTIPETNEEMAYRVTTLGFLLHLSKRIPHLAANAVKSNFKTSICTNYKHTYTGSALHPEDFDWALHPGGKAVIRAVQEAMNLSDEQLRATNKIYRSRGNASSVAVLAVLDELRNMGRGSDNVLACSFGPGLTIEMAKLKRLDRQEG